LVRDLFAALNAKPEPASEPPAEKPEPPAEPKEGGEDFTEKLDAALSEQAEQFKAQIEQERKAREAVAEQFAEERKLRRLREFSDVVNESYAALPAETDQFAADLMAIHDHDVELYGRLEAVLKAANEAISQGGLFKQFSSAQPTEGGDPFEARVEAIRKERFADLDANDGWVKALDVAMSEHPELARAYATTH